MEKISVKFEGKTRRFEVETASEFGKATGLMFRISTTSPLLFGFKNKTNLAIHSFFVFFPFLAVWLDKEFNVTEMKKVNPFSFHIKPKEKYFYLLEIPFNLKYRKTLEFFFQKNKLRIV